MICSASLINMATVNMDPNVGNSMCKSKECKKRHPKPCKFFTFYSRCKFSEFCSFIHNNFTHVEKELDNLKHEIDKLKKENLELREMILKLYNQEITM